MPFCKQKTVQSFTPSALYGIFLLKLRVNVTICNTEVMTLRRGEFLTKLITDKGYTIMSLSKRSGVPYTTIRSMIERDLTNASIDNVIKISKVLGISVEAIAMPPTSVAEENAVYATSSSTPTSKGENWTVLETEEIDNFKQFILSKRQKKK